MLEDDGEQVLAREAGGHAPAVGRDRDRVAVVDDQRLDARAEAGRPFGQQRVADRDHVDAARATPGEQVRALQRIDIDRTREPARARQQHAAAAIAPGAGQAGQQRDQPHRGAAAGVALHAVVQPDPGRPRRRQVARQLADLVRRHAADRRGALGRPLQRALAQRRPALGPLLQVARDVVLVDAAEHDELVHQRQRQRAVAARAQREVAVALVGGLGAPRVDRPQLGAGALGLLREGPEVQVGRDRVAAPDDDQPAGGEVLHVHAELAAVGQRQRLAAGGRADRALQPRRAEPGEEARRHALALHQPHRAGVAVGQDRLRVARRDRAQLVRDDSQRFVPADRLEAPAALGSGAPERRQHAIGVVGPLGVTADLGAQRTLGRRVVGVAGHAHRAPALDAHAPGAGVGAVVRAEALHGGGGSSGGAHAAIVSGRGRRAPRAPGSPRRAETAGHPGTSRRL